MQLTIFTDYGLRTLIYVAADPERRCSVREVAEHYGISRNHLVKVVHHLALRGYLDSSKGKGGGIQLAKAPETLKIGDVVRDLEPNMQMAECFNRETNSCRISSNCQLKHYLMEATNAFIATLNRYTLADAVQDKSLFSALIVRSG